jgi:DNA replication protein DnaC
LRTIDEKLKTLKLSGIAKEWRKVKFISTEKYLEKLIDIEISEREINSLNRRIKSAKFGAVKTFDEFEMSAAIEFPEDFSFDELKKLGFIKSRENLIFLGNVGVGKTHLATATALSACENGQKVRFFTLTELANLLLEKNSKNGLNAFFTEIKKLDLIVIDEIGFVPLHKEAADLVFQVISIAYEKCSLIVTSNLEFSAWNQVFGDKRLTAALVDRLIHHARVVVFSGDSFRLKQRTKS